MQRPAFLFQSRLAAPIIGLLFIFALAMPKLGPELAREVGNIGLKSGYRVSDNYKYDAYGVELATSGATSNAYRFAGEQYDSDLKKEYLRARYLEHLDGRFFGADSYLGEIQNPQSIHKYTYANLAPTSYTDPSGRISVLEIAVGTNIVGMLSSMNLNAGLKTLSRVSGFEQYGYYADMIDYAQTITSIGQLTVLGGVAVYRVGTAVLKNASSLAKLGVYAEQYGINIYRTLTKEISSTGINKVGNTAIEAHHLVEQRFAAQVGGDVSKWPAIILDVAQHRKFTNAWANAIKRGAGTADATIDDIWGAAQEVYRDYPQILEVVKKQLINAGLGE